MIFSIPNGATFTVAIWARPIFVEGEAAQARVDFTTRRILLSDQLPRDERRRELFHELRHAWVAQRGRVTGDEADAVDVAELMDFLLDAYNEQGGDEVLIAMQPEAEETKKLTKWISGPLSQTSANCGCCGQRVMVGSITNGKPEWSGSVQVHLMDRSMHCDACDSITAWREVCDQAGMPLGAIVAFPPPRVLRGADIAKWYAEHGGSCNVIAT